MNIEQILALAINLALIQHKIILWRPWKQTSSHNFLDQAGTTEVSQNSSYGDTGNKQVPTIF